MNEGGQACREWSSSHLIVEWKWKKDGQGDGVDLLIYPPGGAKDLGTLRSCDSSASLCIARALPVHGTCGLAAGQGEAGEGLG